MKDLMNQAKKEIFINFDKESKKLFVKEAPDKIIIDMSDNATDSKYVLKIDDYDIKRGRINTPVRNGSLSYPVIRNSPQNMFEYCSAVFVDGFVKEYQVVPLDKGNVIDSMPKLNNWIINHIDSSWKPVNDIQMVFIPQTFSWGKIRVICDYTIDERVSLKKVRKIILDIN